MSVSPSDAIYTNSSNQLPGTWVCEASIVYSFHTHTHPPQPPKNKTKPAVTTTNNNNKNSRNYIWVLICEYPQTVHELALTSPVPLQPCNGRWQIGDTWFCRAVKNREFLLSACNNPLGRILSDLGGSNLSFSWLNDQMGGTWAESGFPF